MPHNIIGIIVRGPVSEDAVERYDLRAMALGEGLILFHVDHYFTAWWQAETGTEGELDVPSTFDVLFPREAVVSRIARALTGLETPRFLVVMTAYFAGIGGQWACVFDGDRRVSPDDTRIDAALRLLGVTARDGLDEFDVVGLGAHRSAPDYLDRYVGLCEERGL